MTDSPPTSAHAFWTDGNRFFIEKRYPDAIWAYTEAIHRNPLNPAYYHNRAIARGVLSDVTGAAEDAWRAIELDPESRSTHRLASLFCSSTGLGRGSSGGPNLVQPSSPDDSVNLPSVKLALRKE
jgi:tetratricopeptide (TPR) repeat protein